MAYQSIFNNWLICSLLFITTTYASPTDATSATSSATSAASGAYQLPFDLNKMIKITKIHGSLAGLVWVVLFPSGSILLRLFPSKNAWKIHALIQIVATILFIVAAAEGIWVVKTTQPVQSLWHESHIILGLVILAVTICQPFLGYFHHRLFKQRGDGKRTMLGSIHIWIGRILIILGIANGGSGINLAGKSSIQSPTATKNGKIVYGILGAIMGFSAIAVAIWTQRRSSMANGPKNARREIHSAENDGQDVHELEVQSQAK